MVRRCYHKVHVARALAERPHDMPAHAREAEEALQHGARGGCAMANLTSREHRRHIFAI